MSWKPVKWPDAPGEQDRKWRVYVASIREPERTGFDAELACFRELFAGRPPNEGPPLVWWPEPGEAQASNLGRLMREIGVEDYPALHRWTVEEKEAFWEKTIEELGVVFTKPPQTMLDLSNGVEDPRWLPGAHLNVVDSCFRADPDHVAILSGREDDLSLEATSYGELEKLVNRVANGFRERGLAPGDAVALYLPMTLGCVAAYLGVIRAGGRVVSIADSFSSHELARRMQIASADTVITVESYRRGGKKVPLYEKVKQAGVGRAVVMGAPKKGLRSQDLHWEAFLSPHDSLAAVTADPYDVINVLFSSGTTAAPKVIPWTHLTPLKCAMDGYYHQDIRPRDVVAWPTNVGWMMGPWLIFATLINRATMALFEGAPTAGAFTQFVERARVTVLGVVPSLVRAWRNGKAIGDDDWQHVRLFSSTGEPSSREDYLWLMSRTRYAAPVIEYLGGTEIGGAHITGTVVQSASPATFTTPALGIDLVLLDEQGREVAEGEVGELFLVPPALGLSQTLLNKDHEEVYYGGCPQGPNGEILRRHGDRMMRLPHDFLKAQGRADDTMNLGGVKVGSLELEEVLSGHPAVYECAAVSVQENDEGADRLAVFATVHESVDEARLKRELQKRLAEKLNPLFKIYDLVIVDSLPRTASNKLMRRELREAFRERGR